MFMGKPRHASRFHSLTVAIALAVMGLLCLPSSGVRASEGQWKYGGNSTFKVYWQNTLRVENTTNLSILGNVGLLKVGAKAKVSGSKLGNSKQCANTGALGRMDREMESHIAGARGLLASWRYLYSHYVGAVLGGQVFVWGCWKRMGPPWVGFLAR